MWDSLEKHTSANSVYSQEELSLLQKLWPSKKCNCKGKTNMKEQSNYGGLFDEIHQVWLSLCSTRLESVTPRVVIKLLWNKQILQELVTYHHLLLLFTLL